jgi:hypothetical protein
LDITWQESPYLIDTQYRPVLGIHTGDKSDPAVIAKRMGQRIQASPIYWKKVDSPKQACKNKLDAGTIPRLELCLPHILTSTGRPLPTGGNKSFWGAVANGDYDLALIQLLTDIGSLNHAIILSTGHESDLRSEDGASPKNAEPPKEDYCGDWDEYPGFWERFSALARQYAPKARLFLNFSGGYNDAPSRWSTMLPARGTFDFFGWDFYSQYGKYGSTHWDNFEDRIKMYGRWDWYKKNLPDVPLMVGETGVCAGPGGDKTAGNWLLDMVNFMVDNRWKGVGTGGGISHILYFSHHYDAHPRCLDDGGTHSGCDSGQKWAVLPQIGGDTRLSWAA